MPDLEIALTKGYVALVSAPAPISVSEYSWCALTGANGNVYAARRGPRGKLILMHREILDAPFGLEVDHINGNTLDNCNCNLRLATHRENSYNRAAHRDGSSRFKGVSWSRDRRKWLAKIDQGAKQKYLGLYSDEVAAALAYDQAARQMFGQFARLNFPD